MDVPAPSRRERYRLQTIDEIKGAALVQIERGGVEALSLNAIARAMGMSAGALYRYFDNRDDLLADLVADGYGRLADHLERSATPADPRARLRAVTQAYRDWALANANAYRLIFETTKGSGGELAPERIIPAAQRSMNVLLDALAELSPAGGDDAVPPALRTQLVQWGRRASGRDLPPAVLYRGLTLWSRVHGLISLELGQHLRATGVDAAALYASEMERLIEADRGSPRPARGGRSRAGSGPQVA